MKIEWDDAPFGTTHAALTDLGSVHWYMALGNEWFMRPFKQGSWLPMTRIHGIKVYVRPIGDYQPIRIYSLKEKIACEKLLADMRENKVKVTQ
ncbi:hypothetical protein [Photobacterium kishitanii]|uniref:Uncharacterized protein n=1 Tax=Photobacterium kishitanii TaxID=318456 RepID=A0A2T3KMK5_9GAMM|nr:hypothetical protein [Photobacterium kishitanii]PSV01030.1 hypothetical protein C9J27_03100 [Photobacterium kishitanii]